MSVKTTFSIVGNRSEKMEVRALGCAGEASTQTGALCSAASKGDEQMGFCFLITR